jgi:dTMP kinase
MDEDGVASAPGADRDGDVTVYRALLRNRSFMKLMLSTLTSTLGDWIGFLAIIALTSEILGPTRAAAFAVSGVMIARVLPSLLLGPVAGVFVDRWDRKRVMVVTHLGRGTRDGADPVHRRGPHPRARDPGDRGDVDAVRAGEGRRPSRRWSNAHRELVLANQVNLRRHLRHAAAGGALLRWSARREHRRSPPDGSFLAGRPIALPIWFNAARSGVSAPLIATLPMPRRARVRQHLDPGSRPRGLGAAQGGFRFVARQPVIRALIVGVMIARPRPGVVITAGEFFARLLNAGARATASSSRSSARAWCSRASCASGPLSSGSARAPVRAGDRPRRRRAHRDRADADLLAGASPACVMGGGAGVVFIVGYTVLQQRADDRIRGRTFGAFNSGVRLAIFGSAVAVPTVIGLVGREPGRSRPRPTAASVSSSTPTPSAGSGSR